MHRKGEGLFPDCALKLLLLLRKHQTQDGTFTQTQQGAGVLIKICLYGYICGGLLLVCPGQRRLGARHSPEAKKEDADRERGS